MSIGRAANTLLISGLDVSAGLLSAGLVEAVSPPIAGQGILRYAIEGMLQLGCVICVSSEVSALIHRNLDDPTGGLAYQWGVFIGMPNTLGKLAAVGAWGRGQVRMLISKPPPAPVDANTSVPEVKTQQ